MKKLLALLFCLTLLTACVNQTIIVDPDEPTTPTTPIPLPPPTILPSLFGSVEIYNYRGIGVGHAKQTEGFTLSVQFLSASDLKFARITLMNQGYSILKRLELSCDDNHLCSYSWDPTEDSVDSGLYSYFISAENQVGKFLSNIRNDAFIIF